MKIDYILRTCDSKMQGHGGFVWPLGGPIEAPDWDPSPRCGGGLHGFLRGEGDGVLALWDDSAVWLVAAVDADSVVDLGDKVKVPRAWVVYAGKRVEATNKIVELCPGARVVGGTAVAGDHGTAMAGFRGTAVAGDHGTAIAGKYGTAMAGRHGRIAVGSLFAVIDGVDYLPGVAYHAADDKLVKKEGK